MRTAPSPHGGACVTALGGMALDAGTTMGGRSFDGSRSRGALPDGADESSKSVERPFEGGPSVAVRPGRVPFSGLVVARAMRSPRPWNMSGDGGSVFVDPRRRVAGLGSAPATPGGLGTAPACARSASPARTVLASGAVLARSACAVSFGGTGGVGWRSLVRSAVSSGNAGTPTTVFAARFPSWAAVSALPSLSALKAQG